MPRYICGLKIHKSTLTVFLLMKKLYNLSAWLLVLSSLLPSVVRAQSTSVSDYTFVASTAPYVPLSGAARTLSVGDTDDGYYNALPIGFTFRFRGVDYTTVSASTNGFLLLGQNGKTSSPGYINSLVTGGNATGKTIIAPLRDDMGLDVGGLRTSLSGTAPNRVFTVEWRSVKWNLDAGSAAMSFQAKLYENVNVVQLAYDRVIGSLNGASASIGLMGATGEFVSVTGTSAAPTVSTTMARDDIAAKPLSGRVFTFTPARVLYDFGTKTTSYAPLIAPDAVRTGGTADDGYYNGITIGFPFQFRGVSYTTISASTNGWLTFDQDMAGGDLVNNLGGYAEGVALPTMLAPLWDDLDLSGGGFRTSISGTAPNRVLTAEWYNARWQYSAAAPSLSFQVKLFEGSNRVWYLYSPTTNPLDAPSASIGFNDGGYFRSLNNTSGSPTASATTATDNLTVRPAAGQVYAFAATNPLFTPLPVELVDFEAKRSTGTATALAWHTASEKNNAGFGIEKSMDGREFREIAFVAGAGNSSRPEAYGYADAAAPGATYYRLRQQDNDGQASYSPVRFVPAAAPGSVEVLTVFPNPARGTVQVLNATAGAPLTLFDILGRPVRTYTSGVAPLSLSGLPAGLYWLRNARQQVRLVVE